MDWKKGEKIFSQTKIFVLFVLFFVKSNCVDIGSDSAPTRFNAQQELSDGDRVAGFAALEAGLKFSSANIFATFDSFFPVSGIVELNYGIFLLERDFIFSNTSCFNVVGDIVGQGHVLELSVSTTLIPFTKRGESCVINGLIDSSIEAKDVQCVSWSYDDQFIVIGMDDRPSIPIKIYEFDGENLNQRVSDALDRSIEISSVRWHPLDYFFALGRPRINAGPAELRIFEFDPDLDTITETSNINFNVDVYAVAWHPSGDYLAVGVQDNTAELQIYSVDASGVLNVTPVETVNLASSGFVSREAIDWNYDGTFIAIGTRFSSGTTVRVYEFDDGAETLTASGGYNFGQSVNSVDWNPTYTGIIAAGLNGGTNRLSILEHNQDAGTIILLDDVPNTGNPVPSVFAVDWGPCGICLVAGWGSSQSTTQELQSFRFNPSTGLLSLIEGVNYAQPVTSIRWSHDGSYMAVGSDIAELEVYEMGGCSDITARPVTFSDLDIFLNCDVTFQDSFITFTGESSINGRGNCVQLLPTATIRIGQNSSLIFQDVVLMGFEDETFFCADNTSTISFSNVKWILDSDYTFSIGTIDIVNDLHFVGNNFSFSYQSSNTSVIRDNAKLILDNNVTFSYDSPTTSRELLFLESENSEIKMFGATLHATSTGLLLKKGVLNFDGSSVLSSEASVDAEAIIFGDGVDEYNDLKVYGFPASVSDISQGIVIFNNVNG